MSLRNEIIEQEMLNLRNQFNPSCTVETAMEQLKKYFVFRLRAWE